ncbi:MAG: glycosyltransferase, partial [Dehalococcoidales bacterium]
KLDLVHHYGAKTENIQVIPCGVNLDRFRPMEVINREELGLNCSPVILYVGRIEPLKGIDRLIKAMACLADNHNPRLVIIGGDQQSQTEINRLKRLSQELGLAHPVNFLGTIAHQRMPDYYNAASVLVIPSYYESFGLVALEALACGTPVVTTDIGDMKNLIHHGDTGYVTGDDKPTSLASGIDALLSRTTNGTQAYAIRASVAHLSWANIAESVIRECYRLTAETITTSR